MRYSHILAACVLYYPAPAILHRHYEGDNFMLYLIYESSFEGFLTAVFDAFYLRRTDIRLLPECAEPPLLFDCRTVYADSGKAMRVQKGIKAEARHKYALDYFYSMALA